MLVIIGFEGPCLAGKSTLINKLEQQLYHVGYDVLVVPEYTDIGGGHRNLPPVSPQGEKAAKDAATFFLELEKQRMDLLRNWRNVQSGSNHKIALVDRTLFSCIMLRRYLNDIYGQSILDKAIRAGEALIADLIIFVCLPYDEGEYIQRLDKRQKFEGWEAVYRPITPSSFKNMVNEYTTTPFLIYKDSTVKEIKDSITDLIKQDYFKDRGL